MSDQGKSIIEESLKNQIKGFKELYKKTGDDQYLKDAKRIELQLEKFRAIV